MAEFPVERAESTEVAVNTVVRPVDNSCNDLNQVRERVQDPEAMVMARRVIKRVIQSSHHRLTV